MKKNGDELPEFRAATEEEMTCDFCGRYVPPTEKFKTIKKDGKAGMGCYECSQGTPQAYSNKYV